MVDHLRPGERQAEPGEERELERLRGLGDEGGVPVHDTHLETVEVREVLQRVEHGLAVTAQIGRRAHPVEKQRVGRPPVTGIVAVARRVHADVGNAAPVELREQRAEPIRVLVIDRDRPLPGHAHCPPSANPRASAAASRAARCTWASRARSGVPFANWSLVPYTAVGATAAPRLANSGRWPCSVASACAGAWPVAIATPTLPVSPSCGRRSKNTLRSPL